MMDYFRKFYENTFFPYLDTHGITNVIHLGDIVDRRKYINFVTASRLESDLVGPLRKRNINSYWIIGNHDSSYKNSLEINSMKELYANDINSNMVIIQEPTELTFDGVNIVLQPWMCAANMEQSLGLIKNTKSQILFGHLELAGFEMYRGSVVEHGMDSDIFDKFDVVCSGHFHHRSSNGRINYLGCPYEITWSDYGDQKGFHVFDTETRELTFIPNPYKLFNKVHYDDAKQVDSEFISSEDYASLKDTYVKVIVHSKNNPYWFDLFIDNLEKIGPTQIQIVDDNLYLDLEDDDDIISEAEDTLTILKKFVAGSDLNIEKSLIEKAITDLYVEAQSL